MSTVNQGNQAEHLDQGHVPNGDLSDPHAHTVDGGHIGLGSNFGIVHHGSVDILSDGPTQK